MSRDSQKKIAMAITSIAIFAIMAFGSALAAKDSTSTSSSKFHLVNGSFLLVTSVADIVGINH